MKQVVGKKFDKEKIRYDLIPPEALEALANLYTKGAVKYGENNWMQGLEWKRIYRALLGHAIEWRKGNDLDEEGNEHLIAVAWNAIALWYYQTKKIGIDDRNKL